jgi:alkanesulfonate monooxygenase SsuD/methylene tetrahydromethanopterin reductase-like flavin-dependent oxidoreductase (luciferase family)
MAPAPTATPLQFAIQIGAVAEAGSSDQRMYREAISDARHAQDIGFDAVWLVEHHFSDYYPTPNPLMFLSHLAAAVPGMDLGTAVMVLPWYDPVRFAEDVAMLQSLTTGNLHLGLGRGTAKLEYDAMRVDMSEARSRFQECWEITRLALQGKPFTYKGKHTTIERPLTVRPVLTGKQPSFYGAIGSPATAEVMGDLGLAPLCLSQFPDYMLMKILANWRTRAKANGFATEGLTLPISMKCYIGDTDEAARAEAKKYMPYFYQLQAEHYTVDSTPWKDIAGYEQFAKIFGNMKQMADPEKIDPILDRNLVGSPKTVTRQVNALRALGFNYFLVSNATAGVPLDVRQRMMRRFMEEVAPMVRATPADQIRPMEVRAAGA